MTKEDYFYVICGAVLRLADREDELIRDVLGTLTPDEPLYLDIMRLARDCGPALIAGPGSEELTAWNHLWSRTVRACRKRVC